MHDSRKQVSHLWGGGNAPQFLNNNCAFPKAVCNPLGPVERDTQAALQVADLRSDGVVLDKLRHGCFHIGRCLNRACTAITNDPFALQDRAVDLRKWGPGAGAAIWNAVLQVRSTQGAHSLLKLSPECNVPKGWKPLYKTWPTGTSSHHEQSCATFVPTSSECTM